MHCSRHWAHDIWHAKNVSIWGIEFFFQHVNLLTFKIKKLCRNLLRSQILGHQTHVNELKTIAVTERCELRDFNTHTYSRVHSDIFLLKSTVSTDDDSPPVFHWNVKHTHVSSSLLLNWSAVFLSFHMFKWPFSVLLQAPHILMFQCWLQLWVSQPACVKYGIYVTYITTKGEMTQNHQNSDAVFEFLFIYLFGHQTVE